MDGKTFSKLLPNISGSYILVTSDPGLANLYINRILKSLSATKAVISSLDKFKPIGGLIPNNFVYVLYSNKLDENLFLFDRIIQVCDKIDNRTTFAKQYKDRIIQIDSPKKEDLIDYIKQHSDLSEESATRLAHKCVSLAQIINELHKYKYSESIYDEFESCIYEKPKDAIFDLVNAIITKQDFKVHLQHCKDIEESPLAILSVLCTTAKQILQIQNCGKDIDSTGIDRKKAFHISKQCRYCSNAELMFIIQLCNRLDMNIRKGLLDTNIVVDYMIIKILEYRKAI